ncbi:DUF3618 domain-containing protein [Streptomyces sp. NPDC003327]
MNQPHHEDPDTASSPQALRAQVEHTREELGQTVGALAARTDVTARAQEKAAEVKQQAAAKAEELKAQAAHAAAQVREKIPGPVKDKAASAADQARTTAAHAAQLLQDKAPEPVRQKAAEGAQAARDHRKLLLVAAAGAVLVWAACRRKKG